MRARITRRGLGLAAIVAGAALLGWVALEFAQRSLAQRKAARELVRELPPIESAIPQAIPRPRPAKGEPVARISIAEAGVDAVALEGVETDILDRAVGHFPTSALPGEIGNASFAAHRDTFFRGLRHVSVGQLVQVETSSSVMSYRIEETRVVEPTQVDVIEPRGGKQLTLITCHPFDFVGPAPRRFVVHARWVGQRPTGGPGG